MDPPDVDGDGESTTNLATGMMAFSLVVWLTAGHHLASTSRYVGEGMAAALTGLALAATLLAARAADLLPASTTASLLTFDHASFFVFFLPPIVLQAGLSVRRRTFFGHAGAVAALGVGGTFVSFAALAAALKLVARPLGLTTHDCLALGAIFAATDSVAVLQVLHEDSTPLLFSIVFGEGVVNDATTVVLLRSVASLGGGGRRAAPPAAAAVSLVASFAALLAASLALGVAAGLAGALALKKYPPHSSPAATGVVLAAGYVAYSAGDGCALSGIVALFSAAVALAHYGLPSLPRPQRAAARSAAETLAALCEGAIFVYVGLDALDPRTWARARVGAAAGLAAVVLATSLLARAAFVFPLLAATGRLTGGAPLPRREAAAAWWAGGARGAVSVALAYSVYSPAASGDGDDDDGRGATLIAATLLVVLVSTLGFGAAAKPLLDRLLGGRPASAAAAAATTEMAALLARGSGRGGGSASGGPHPALRAKPTIASPTTSRPPSDAGAPLAASWPVRLPSIDGRPPPGTPTAADALVVDVDGGATAPPVLPRAPAAGALPTLTPPRPLARSATAPPLPGPDFGGWWADFDARVMRPVFSGSRVTLDADHAASRGPTGSPHAPHRGPLATAASDAPAVVALAPGEGARGAGQR